MQKFKIKELKEHPKNTYFFDDMNGEKWKEFIDSIKTSGVIEPIVITQDKMIVSGHQRVRACKELGIEEVDCKVHIYDSEDEILKCLLETNIRQRGDVGGSQLKMGRRIVELERLYGVKRGRPENRSNGPNFTQEQLAEKLGIDERTLKRVKKLATLPPEIQDFVESGTVSPSVASRIIARLPKNQQLELAESINPFEKQTQKDIEAKIAELTERAKKAEENRDKAYLAGKTDAMKSNEYLSLKEERDNYKKDSESMTQQFKSKVAENQDLRRQLQKIKEESPEEVHMRRVCESCITFCNRVSKFVEDVGGYAWLTDYINELPEVERTGYLRAINVVESWVTVLSQNIKNKTNN